MGAVRHVVVPCGNYDQEKCPTPRVRTELKYGRDEGRRLAPIQRGPAA
jgi:hypothetical protein